MRFLGHATWLIESEGVKIVIDPFITGNPQSPVQVRDLFDVNYIIVTHGHGDHLGDTREIAVRSGATVVCNYEIGLYLGSKGVTNIHTMHIGGRAKFDFGWIKLTPAVHGSSIQERNSIIYGGMPAGVLIEIGGRRIYHAGDTGLTKDMELLADEMVDVALLPIGGNYTMDVYDAAKAVAMIKPKLAVPMHYGTFPVIEADPEEFVREVSRRGFSAKVVRPGEWLQI